MKRRKGRIGEEEGKWKEEKQGKMGKGDEKE
jgi:hypothetical protein